MSLIAETSNPQLADALQAALAQRGMAGAGLGPLLPLAVRLGLLQGVMQPRLMDPQLVLFAADHGLAVEGLPSARPDQTGHEVQRLLAGQAPLSAIARQAGMTLLVVDCGVASHLPHHERLVQRKIAHGTRNARLGPAMTLPQAHAAIRAGMEIGEAVRGNVLACAGLGVGSDEAAALVLSRLAQVPIRELLVGPGDEEAEALAHLMIITQGAQGRHREVSDPVEVLAAFGGFEMAVMVGAMLVAAGKRHLIMVDGLAACAALWVAARISAAVTDYCVFCRSSAHPGLDRALALFNTSPLLSMGLDTQAGTGACLSWPLVRSAAALLDDAPPVFSDEPLSHLRAPSGLG